MGRCCRYSSCHCGVRAVARAARMWCSCPLMVSLRPRLAIVHWMANGHERQYFLKDGPPLGRIVIVWLAGPHGAGIEIEGEIVAGEPAGKRSS
jgi:hypothetical protein